jgi:hypothetical protein
MPLIVYKLTDENKQTYGGFPGPEGWEIGKTYKTSGKGELCGPGFLHAYHHPLLAVLHNRIHADYDSPRLFLARAAGKILCDGQMKLGSSRLTLLEEMELPLINMTQRVAYGIIATQKVIGDACPAWSQWAEEWLSGKDRSAEAAEEAAWAAREAWAAARAARAAWAAAEAAAEAAEAAAARAAARDKSLNLIACAESAMMVKEG